MMYPSINVEHLTKSYKFSRKQAQQERQTDRVKTVVDDLSFEVYPAQIFGLLGPNGAGKTTTLRILAGLVKPDEGDAFINGTSILSEATKARCDIGFLTSELKLEEVFTPDYLFDFFSELHHVAKGDREAQKQALFNRFGIKDFAHTKVAELSTGMKQKTSLAIALVHNPSVIIFDEPTNGLDVITAKTVTDFLGELKGEGKTILVSSHIFSLIEKVCDSVGVLINGRLVACGPLNEVKGAQGLEDAFFDLYKRACGDSNE